MAVNYCGLTVDYYSILTPEKVVLSKILQPQAWHLISWARFKNMWPNSSKRIQIFKLSKMQFPKEDSKSELIYSKASKVAEKVFFFLKFDCSNKNQKRNVDSAAILCRTLSMIFPWKSIKMLNSFFSFQKIRKNIYFAHSILTNLRH